MMKKFKKVIVVFLALILAISVFACGKENGNDTPKVDPLIPKGEILLKVGVIGDSQVRQQSAETGNMKNSTKNLKLALSYYKENPIDVLVMVGDMVDYARASAYDAFNGAIDDIYGSERTNLPKIIYSPGNHEMFNVDNSTQVNFANNLFKEKIGTDVNTYDVIKGYPFISLATNTYTSGEMTKGTVDFLEENFAKAMEEAQGKPIFIANHYPIKNTVYGSEGTDASPRSNELKFLLKKYPNVIYLSGHSHHPLLDERSIFQKEFTSINSGTLSYSCVGVQNAEGKYVNSGGYVYNNTQSSAPWVPVKNEVSGAETILSAQGMVINVYENVSVVDRIDFYKKEKAASSWTIQNTGNINDFIYTSARKEVDSAPYFESTENITAKLENSNITVDFVSAKHDFMVESYLIELKKVGEDEGVKKIIVSDYYCNYSGGYSVSFSVMDSVSDYQVSIIPFSQFGTQGPGEVISVIR